MNDDGSGLNPEKIPWAYSVLFACCVFRTFDSVEAAVEERLCCESPLDPNLKADCIGLFFTGPDGLLTRRRLHHHQPSLLAKKSKSTRDKIHSFVLESVKVQNYQIVYVMTRLKPAFVDVLFSYSSRRGIDDSSYSYNNMVNDLVNDLLPVDLGERIDASSSFNAPPHVLYLEPSLKLENEHISNSTESDVQLLQNLGSQLGVHLGWLVPAKILGDFLFSGAGIGNRDSSFVVVNTLARDDRYLHGDWEESYIIPWLPLALLNHSVTLTITQYCNGSLQSHVFLSRDYWGLSETWGSFNTYRSKYLSMRLEVEQLVKKAEELGQLLENHFSTIPLYNDKCFTHFTDEIQLNGEIADAIKTSLPLFLKAQRLASDEQLSKTLAKLRSRVSLLDEFLRDSGIADATHANLKLAQSVQTLTWVVTIIAVLTFFITLIPDTMKLSLLSKALSKPTMEWLLDAKE